MKNSKDIGRSSTMVGFLFASGLVLASFSYKSGIINETKIISKSNPIDITYLVDEQKVEKPIIEIKDTYVPPVTENIKKEENKDKDVNPIINVKPPDIDIVDTLVEIKKEIIKFPDVDAIFDGGVVEMKKWVAENVVYPEVSIQLNEHGTVYLSFVVEVDGTISNVKVERGISSDIDSEAKRILRKMPKWIPGEVSGKKVRTKCSLPIIFELE